MSLSAPTVIDRVRIPDDTIQELITRIAAEFQPRRIILFGSYAYGRPRPDSDVDLLVIMETRLRESEQALRIRRSVNPRFGVDILVYTPSRLAQRLKWGDSFLKEITEKGRIVYESPDSGMDREG
jgi:predicted nucleotidyltransferase